VQWIRYQTIGIDIGADKKSRKAVMSELSWAHRAVLSYFLGRGGRPAAPHIISAMIGEGVQAVEQACNDLVEAKLLTKLVSSDASRARYQLEGQAVQHAHTALATGMIIPQ
jgi:hypothetical protein